MIDIEKLRAGGKKVNFMDEEIILYPLKTEKIAELSELQSKDKFVDSSMLLIRESFNRMIEEEIIADEMKKGKSRKEAREIAKKSNKFLTNDDVNEFDQEELNKIVPEMLIINGLKVPKKKPKQKTSENK